MRSEVLLNVADSTRDRVETLLEEGLELYGRGLEERAIAAWREALSLRPDSVRARDYLEAAGALSEHPPEPTWEPSNAEVTESQRVRREVLQLVRDKRYDDALRVLYADRLRRPDDPALTRSIQHLKAKVVEDSILRLGDMSRAPAPVRDLGTLDPETRLVARLADGIASLADIAESAPLGRERTLRALVRLFADGDRRPGSLVPPTLTPVPAPKAPNDGFDEAFAKATRAYIVRDLEGAQRHFERCLEIRPNERRALHNLIRIRERMKNGGG